MDLPLDIRVDIAPDAEPGGDPADWAWLDVSSYRRQSVDIGLNVGRDDESSDVEPADSSLVFDLRDSLLSPRNPASELFGRIGVNTPIRYRLAGLVADTFSRTVAAGDWGTADTGQAWAGTSVFSVSGGEGKAAIAAANTASEVFLVDPVALDLDVVYSASVDAVTTGAPWISALEVRRVDAANCYLVHTEFKPSGVITVKIVKRVAAVNFALDENLSVAPTYTADSKVWTRVQAVGAAISARVWSGLITDEPDTWDVSADDSTIEGAGFGFFQWRFAGNTNAGTLTASIDNLGIDAILFVGNVPEWPPRWDKSGNDSTLPIAAAGPLRLLSVGDDPIKSPLTRQLPQYGPTGHWPVEDDAGAQTIGSALAGGLAATYSDVTLASDTVSLPGAAAMAKIDSAAARVTGRCSPQTTAFVEFAALIFYKLPSIPGVGVEYRLVEWESEGTVRWWQIYAGHSGFQLRGLGSDGTLLVDPGVFTYNINPLNAFSIQLETNQNGGNLEWALIWNEVGVDGFWAGSGSVAGTCGKPVGVKINGPTFPDALFGQIWIGPETLPYVDATFLAVAAGYAGELAADRIARLCAEEGVRVAIGSGTSEPMGRQTSDKFVELLRTAARSDLGILYERGGALAYVPRGGLYNQTASLELDWTGGQLAEAPRPTDDDQRLRNRWTVKRTNGSEATAQNDASIARHGTLGDSSEVNIESDSRLADYASWMVSLASLDELRWPSIEIDLVAQPGLIPGFLSLRIGSRITVVNPKVQIAGTTIDLIVEGINQTIGRHRWDVELICSPATLFLPGVYDTARYDSGSTVTHAGYAAGVSTIVFRTANLGDLWSTSATPYSCICAGERFAVTVMGPDGKGAQASLPGWNAAVDGTWVRSTAQAKTGSGSCLLTVVGSPSQTYVRQPAIPVTVGVSYRIVMWAYSVAGASNILAVIDWLDSGGGYLSSSAQNLTLAAATWTSFDLTAVAPASTAFAQYGPTIGSSPTAGTEIFVDDINFQQASGQVGWLQTATVVRGVNGISKTLPADEPIHVATPGRYAL